MIKYQIVDSYVIEDIPSMIACISATSSNHLLDMLSEISRTHGYLYNSVSPRYVFRNRWDELVLSLELDGYRLSPGEFIEIETTLPGETIIDDDLTRLLKKSMLEQSSEILLSIDRSGQDYLKSPPDYNGTLSNARIALETMAKVIASEMSWGSALLKLRESGSITKNQEIGLAGIYTFISDGVHNALGVDDKEMARLGRSLALNACYFLLKLPYLNQ